MERICWRTDSTSSAHAVRASRLCCRRSASEVARRHLSVSDVSYLDIYRHTTTTITSRPIYSWASVCVFIIGSYNEGDMKSLKLRKKMR